MSNIMNVFTLLGISYVTKCGPAGILEGNTNWTDVWQVNAQIFIQKDFSNILTAR